MSFLITVNKGEKDKKILLGLIALLLLYEF